MRSTLVRAEATVGQFTPVLRRQLCRSPLPLALLSALAPVVAQAEVAGDMRSSFDESMLRARGIDPRLANRLYEKPRFTEGVQRVTLLVNGEHVGRVNARFDGAGELCFDAALLEVAKLHAPTTSDRHDIDGADTARSDECLDFIAAYPQTRVDPQPESLTLELLVPTEARHQAQRDLSHFSRGGTAALLNYDIVAMESHFGDRRSRFWSASTEAGFNAGDWIVRSRQIHTSQDGQRRTAHLDAYAQRTFADHAAVVQLGQINAYNPALSGARITGVQIANEQALAGLSSNAAPIKGIAQGQARIEVLQDGVLIHSTVVPAGPFALGNIRRLNSRADLEVVVHEEDGSIQRFVVPAVLAGLDAPAPGWAFALGQLRDPPRNLAERHPGWLASGGWTGAVGHRSSLSAGAMAATNYLAVGLGTGLPLWAGAQTQVSAQLSRSSTATPVHGVQGSAAFSQQVSDRWSLNAGTARRGAGYRELQQAQLNDDGASQWLGYKSQYSLATGWNAGQFGIFSAGATASRAFDGRRSHRGIASWGATFGRTSVSATGEWSLGGDRHTGNAVYFSASVPLGAPGRRLRSSARVAEGHHRTGMTFSDQINDRANYRVGVEQNSRGDRTSLSSGLSLLSRYAQVDLGHNRDNAGFSSFQGGLRGGIAVHAEGATLAPYPLQDTFAVISVGDLPGIKVSTPSGPVWTDRNGRAVVAQMSPFAPTVIEVSARSLPRDVELGNGLALINAGRGAVEQIDFEVSRTRRVLLKVSTSSGLPLPRGAAVSTGEQHLVTLVQADGGVFLSSVEEGQRYWVSLPDGQRCELHFEMPRTTDAKAFYETLPATCTLP